MFVHFPTALYPVAIALELLSRVQSDRGYFRSATILIGLGIAGSVPAAITGLVDWLGMVPGSTKRRQATKHLLAQSCSMALVAPSFAVHASSWDRGSSLPGLVLLVAAVIAMVVGNWWGGVLVYRMAMRVGGKAEPSR